MGLGNYFTKGLRFEYQGSINSPTFTIMKVYQGDLTLHRYIVRWIVLILIRRILLSRWNLVIEWAEIITDILPEERLDIILLLANQLDK